MVRMSLNDMKRVATNDDWSDANDNALLTAASEVPPGSEGRWANVAELLGGAKSAKECKARFEQLKATGKLKKFKTGKGGKGSRGSKGGKGGNCTLAVATLDHGM